MALYVLLSNYGEAIAGLKERQYEFCWARIWLTDPVQQSCFTNTFVIASIRESVSQSAFSSKYLEYHKSQTVKARELKHETCSPPATWYGHMFWTKCWSSKNILVYIYIQNWNSSEYLCNISNFYYIFFFLASKLGKSKIFTGEFWSKIVSLTLHTKEFFISMFKKSLCF